jgi:hypothetical protein
MGSPFHFILPRHAFKGFQFSGLMRKETLVLNLPEASKKRFCTKVLCKFCTNVPSFLKVKVLAQTVRQPYAGNKLTFSAEDILQVAQSSVLSINQ